MGIRAIVAIVRRRALPAVEARLVEEQAPGITVMPVKGYGEYANYFSRDLLVPHVRIEIFADEETVGRLVDAIVESAHTGETGDGFVGVLPALDMIRIRTGKAPDRE